jgi:putative membrane protein
MWMWHGYGVWSWFVGALVMVAFWATVIWLVLQFAREREPTSSSTRAPEDILAERYARGEIESDEYRQRLDELTSRHR